MRYHFLSFILLVWGSVLAEGRVQLAVNGSTSYVILRESGALAAEVRAATELAQALEKITGAKLEVREVRAAGDPLPARAILVGPGPIAARLFPGIAFDQLGGEEIVMRTKGQRLLLAGGRPRGTLYAVSRFLQECCGVRWWTPWAAEYPFRPNLIVPDLDRQTKPAFESRDPFWFPAFNPDWAVRNCSNSQSARLTDEMGGCIQYKGFVHTFYPLVPPDKYFSTHPEWYSLVKGKRTADHAQLCLANPQLRDFVVERVKEWLRESPRARIVSVSQNDWYGACECPDCKALDDAEGSHAGSLLAFVNHVAEKIAPEFPAVAIDTLAYQYTRQAPKTIRPRPNVIVRLCSIECNFGVPLDDPANAAFARDMQDWSQICQRLYIWDYTTDFAHYVQPHPNWFSLGPNVRFFHQYHGVGLFEQGAYQSNGSEMSELRAWLLAQLLWNPAQDDRTLITEFLNGYYGRAAARPIGEYFHLMHLAARGCKLTCFSSTETPFHKFSVLAEAERLWQQAEAAARSEPEKLWRVRQGHLAVRYVWLTRWAALRQECRQQNARWPLPESRKAAADDWFATATGPGPAGWSRMTHLSESGLTPENFIKRFAQDQGD